jgi:hypothetical protein
MPRKPTIDDQDDIDDEDGVLQEELEEDNDLSVHEEDESTIGLGGTPDGTIDPGRTGITRRRREEEEEE